MKNFLRKTAILTSFLLVVSQAFSQSLTGNYTVDSTGAGDYISLQQAADALVNKGVSDPVTININPGEYLGQTWIDSIPGTSQTNTVTIRSATGDSADVTLAYDSNSNYDTVSTLYIDSTDHIYLEDLTIKGLNSVNAIYIGSEATSIQIERCHILGGYNKAIHIESFVEQRSTGNYFNYYYIHEMVNNITIKNNNIFSEGAGIHLVHDGVRRTFQDINVLETDVTNDIFILDNTINVETGGIVSDGANHIEIINNKIHVREDFYDYAINTNYYFNDYTIKNNEIITNSGGIYITTLGDDLADSGLIVNNFVSSLETGINISYTPGAKVYFNSFNIRDDYRSHGESVIELGDSVEYYNNIFANHSDEGYMVEFDTFYVSMIFSDYNLYYSKNKNSFARNWSILNDTIKSLDSFRTVFGTDEHSMFSNPNFLSQKDLHAASAAVKDNGKPIASITKDIDGEQRDLNAPDIGADEIAALANMVPQEMNVSAQSVFSGTAVQVDYRVKNIGFRGVTGPWDDALYLSNDTVLDEDNDTHLTTVYNNINLNQSATYDRDVTVTLPQDISGQFYILLNIDVENETFEDGNDNLASPGNTLEIKLSPRADLAADSVRASRNVYSGKSLRLEWKVENKGSEATTSSWSDYIYAARDSQALANLNTLPDSLFVKKVEAPVGLKTGKKYSQSTTIEIPYISSGTRYYMVVSDGGSSISEELESITDNSGISNQVAIQQSPIANLKVENFTIQPSGFSGEHARVSYTVKNMGTAPTLKDSWSDRVLLSSDSTPDLSTNFNKDQKKKFEHYMNLQPDSSYSVVDSVFLGNCVADTFSAFVQVDYYDQVKELIPGDNLYGPDTVEVLLEPKPDLVVEDLNVHTADPSSGDRLEISFEVKNDGFSNADHYKEWFDRVFLDYDTSFNEDNSFKLGGVAEASSLEKDSSYLVSETFRIPDSIHGDYYVYAYTDRGDDLCEAPNEDNNITRTNQRVNISLTPPPDLDAITIPSGNDLNTGDNIPVNYEIENIGTGQTPENQWKDHVYLQKEGQKLKNAYLLVKNDHQGSLDTGETYAFSSLEAVPLELDSGSYRLVLSIDNEDEVYEHTNKYNNKRYSNYFNINFDPGRVSDLEITNLAHQGTLNTGNTIQVEYTIRNNSRVTNENSWIDRIYMLDGSGKIIKEQQEDHFGGIGQNQDTVKTVDFFLPHGRNGEYTIVADVDTTHRILDFNPANNKEEMTVYISLSPSPDLQVDTINAKDSVNAGQEFMVDYTIANKGAGPTFDTSWTDRVYFSKDTLYDRYDKKMAFTKVNQSMAPGNQYKDTVKFQVPLYLSGNFYVIVKADQEQSLYEGQWEDNNASYLARKVFVYSPNPSDLVAGDTAVQYAGGTKLVTYKVENKSNNTAQGDWTDVLYLSSDTIWDVNDWEIGQAEAQGMQLDQNESYKNSFYADVPVVQPGHYRIIARADVFNNIPETDNSNNYIVSLEYIFS